MSCCRVRHSSICWPRSMASRAVDGRKWFGGPRAVVAINKRGEIWLRHRRRHAFADRADRHVRPDDPARHGARCYAGRRVIHTLSKDNAPRWIHDWVQFYQRRTRRRCRADLRQRIDASILPPISQAQLRAAFPAMVIHVISWPFRYGPQGGLAGAVDGVRKRRGIRISARTGSMAARAPALSCAMPEAVLNVDIDELVLSDRGRSIFAATEAEPPAASSSSPGSGSAAPALRQSGKPRHAAATPISRTKRLGRNASIARPNGASYPARHGPLPHQLVGAQSVRIAPQTATSMANSAIAT